MIEAPCASFPTKGFHVTQLFDSPACALDGCVPAHTNANTEPTLANVRLEVSVVSDTICPWCYVGKRRIERAIAELASEGLSITTRWLPFELNPKMPADGLDRRAYRSAKFGSWERSQALDAQVAAEGAREGIEFRHDLVTRTPNTRLSHRLVWLAGEVGGATVQGHVVESLLAAYFTQGRDVGDRQVLADIGIGAGLPPERVDALLAGNEGTAEVLDQETWAMSVGVKGVPSVISGRSLLFSGAQRTPLVVQALRGVAMAYGGAEAVTRDEADAHG
jgi:predicted DsbA family dithiol-disulfide isomerase